VEGHLVNLLFVNLILKLFHQGTSPKLFGLFNRWNNILYYDILIHWKLNWPGSFSLQWIRQSPVGNLSKLLITPRKYDTQSITLTQISRYYRTDKNMLKLDGSKREWWTKWLMIITHPIQEVCICNIIDMDLVQMLWFTN
jgi:hypothetical protein